MQRTQKPFSMSGLVDVVRHFAVTVKSFIVKLRLVEKLVCCHMNILVLAILDWSLQRNRPGKTIRFPHR
jgi:hypothetical protein